MPSLTQRQQAALTEAVAELAEPGTKPESTVATLVQLVAAQNQPTRDHVALAVRLALSELAHRQPGQSVELRVPPYAAVQVGAGVDGPGAGPRHTRGTPPAVVEMTPPVLLKLLVGQLTWLQAVAERQVSASGAHTDLSGLFPLS
ncbi:MAG: sterol carrier family protein [Propionibacteriaceae bacterium]|nr:sterol carrier family protein [Propionibacteriaceae bacterium]